MEDKLIDFEELYYLFKKRWWIVILITMITTSIAIKKVSSLQPSYYASGQVILSKSEKLMEYYSEEELEYYSKFISTYREVIKIDGSIEKLLNKKNIEVNSNILVSGLNISQGSNIPLFTLSYTSNSDKDLKKIIDIMRDDLISRAKDTISNCYPSKIGEVTVSTIYPDKKKLPIIAFVVGVVISIGLILVLDYFDDRIVSKKQLQRILDIPILADIPTHERSFKKEDKNANNK